MSPFQIQSTVEAIQQLTQEAAALAARLGQLIAALQQSSSTNVASTSQHLALYQEAVQTLQVVIADPFCTATKCSCKHHYNTALYKLAPECIRRLLRQTPQQPYNSQLRCSRNVKSCTMSSVR